jgi:hypothetical protein
MKSLSTPNPFKTLLATLSDSEWQTVTLDYLNHLSKLVNEPRMVVGTYGDAFSVLEFLAAAGAIELEPTDTAGVHKIRKKAYGNETSES